MPSYTLDELIKIMEPQARRDKELINKCIHGLETYAAQQAMTDSGSPKIAEMRNLVEMLVGYWGLDDTDNGGKPLDEYLLSFDNLIVDIKSGAEVSASQYEKANTIYGLFRYGTEMVTAQGSDAVFDILSIKKLMNEIAEFWDFESDVLDNLTGQLVAEVQWLAGPLSERDNALKNECIAGLGLYAAEKVRDNYFSDTPDELRKLIGNLVGYWGLDDGDNAKPLDDYLDTFDEQIWNAKHRKEVPWVSSEHQVGAIYGLYRYGDELIANQGSDAMSELLDMGDLMKNIAMYWEFRPYDIVTDLADRLRAEVRNMLADITLPGQPAVGENVGYQMQQGILFNNDRGFVLAHHPKAPAPYVTWTFTDRSNGRGYDVGHYFVTEERARLDYISRVTDYIEAYKVTEKPVQSAAAEMDAEQNYNMIDGVRNNEGVPKPDLTDGQTYEEIRELAPEMLPDENASPDIRLEALRESLPLVTVTFSEHEQLRGIEKMPLYLADILFSRLDAMPRDERSADGAPYHKTDFRIDYIMDGKPDSYGGHYDVGDGDGSLVDHIRAYAEYNRHDESYQQYLAGKGGDEQEVNNNRLDEIINELVPYFRTHCKLYEMEAAALSELMDIRDKAEGRPSEAGQSRIPYLESVAGYAERCREALNTTGLDGLPQPPQPVAAAATEEKSGRDEKTSVLDRIKASRQAPQQPHKPKTERDDRSQGPEL